ncbi:putative protein kinase RLK-Pelle-DLSV family [Helianthus annuus]|nr:putative protein kinase RLK-Pelle-DLSV family [Helianthus annuus]
MRSQDYSFYDEYTGPDDTTVCGNTTRKSTMFQESTRQVVVNAVTDKTKGRKIGWEMRFKIIIGIAEGLVYLHENTNNRIIHMDIKASNILLDFRLRPKMADFGLARSFQGDKSHISTAVAGTLGYMAPEYLAHGQLTEKADVYSFGIFNS